VVFAVPKFALQLIRTGGDAMYDADKLVKHTREGIPNGYDAVTDTYEFEPQFKRGQISRVVVIFHPGHGYTTILYIDGKTPSQRSSPNWQWGSAKFDLEEALLQHQCDLFTIKDPRQP